MSDLTIVAADVNVLRWGTSEPGKGGASLTPGAPCYYDTSEGTLKLAEADDDTHRQYAGLATRTSSSGEANTLLNEGDIYLGSALDGLNLGAWVYLSATAGKLADASPVVDEKQQIAITGTPGGGTFTLSYGGSTTATIAYNAAASAVQTALEALPGLKGNILVTGSNPTFAVEFVNDLKGLDVAMITADASSLTGGTSPAVTVTQTQTAIAEVRVGYVIPHFGSSYTTPQKVLRVIRRK